MKAIKEYMDEYNKIQGYPFHMPGHKRQVIKGNDLTKGFAYDYTEITGFDNLHQPEGFLKKAQERASRIYGSQDSYYLVNGSTCGILTALSAACERGSEILLHRGSHKAAYHAAFLRQLKVHYLYPDILENGLGASVQPRQVEEMLEKYPKIKVVFLTSPTYDGIVSDIPRIASIAHHYGAILIVDEAHGAHFGFDPNFPQTAVRLGADLVIQSMHKTLSAYTQSALLHRCSQRVSPEKIMFYLDIYETSSPSYLMMAQMDECLKELEENGKEIFHTFSQRLRSFSEKIKEFTYIRAFEDSPCIFGKDPSKILLQDLSGNLSGKEIFDRLRKEDHLELEMHAGNFATALTSYADTPEGFDRLYEGLGKIDDQLQFMPENHKEDAGKLLQTLYHPKEKCMEAYEAEEAPYQCLKKSEAQGKISQDYMYLYPPGIPFYVPGERITKESLMAMDLLEAAGYDIQGLKDQTKETIRIVKEDG